jgi:DNA-binding MarR family transcriptional regulator
LDVEASRLVTAEPHPATGLDELVHQRVRLGILAVLAEATECSFAAVRDTLELTDGNLSRHVQVLHEAGLLELRKGYEARRPRTWLRITREGRRALRAELATLERLVARLRKS